MTLSALLWQAPSGKGFCGNKVSCAETFVGRCLLEESAHGGLVAQLCRPGWLRDA